jgi:glycosyltransferase involved in cell wall biosynthesis
MRIAMLGTSGARDPSPRGRWLPIARELVRRGHGVDLLLLHPAFDRADAAARHSVVDGVAVRHVAQMHVYDDGVARRYFGAFGLLRVSLAAALALYKNAIALRPDAIHICKAQPINALAGLLAARRLRVPVFLDCDDYEAGANRFSSAWQRALVARVEDALPARVAGVTVNTRFLQQRCARLGARGDVAYVPNGVAPAQIAAAAVQPDPSLRHALGLGDAPVVVYAGAMSTLAHGVDLLIDAFAQVYAALPAARLLMLGQGDERAALQQRAQDAGLSDAVIWAGAVPAEQVPGYFALAACSVDPVRDSEAARARSPLKIVESLARGVPVVTGDVGDRRETLLGGVPCGVIVVPGDVRALADGILGLLCDDSARLALAAHAPQRAAQFTWPTLVDAWEARYGRSAKMRTPSVS